MTDRELRQKLSKFRNESIRDESVEAEKEKEIQKSYMKSMNYLIFHEEEKKEKSEIKATNWPF